MAFRSRHTLRFGDVDSAGIVYYPRYLHYCHVAMEEFFDQVLGVPYSKLVTGEKLGFPTVRLEMDFHRPLRYGDQIEIEVEIERAGESSLAWRFTFFKVGEPAAASEARVVTVALDLASFVKQPVPDWVRAAISAG